MFIFAYECRGFYIIIWVFSFLQGKLDDYHARNVKGERLNQDQLVGKLFLFLCCICCFVFLNKKSVFESI